MITTCSCVSDVGNITGVPGNCIQISLCVPPKLHSEALVETNLIQGGYAPGEVIISCNSGYRYKGDNLRCDEDSSSFPGEIGECILEVVTSDKINF